MNATAAPLRSESHPLVQPEAQLVLCRQECEALHTELAALQQRLEDLTILLGRLEDDNKALRAAKARAAAEALPAVTRPDTPSATSGQADLPLRDLIDALIRGVDGGQPGSGRQKAARAPRETTRWGWVRGRLRWPLLLPWLIGVLGFLLVAGLVLWLGR